MGRTINKLQFFKTIITFTKFTVCLKISKLFIQYKSIISFNPHNSHMRQVHPNYTRGNGGRQRSVTNLFMVIKLVNGGVKV